MASLLLQHLIQNPILQWFFAGPLVLIILDLLTGLIAAWKTGTFSFHRLHNFYGKNLLGYAVASLVVLIAGLTGQSWISVVMGVFGFGPLTVAVVKSIASNCSEIAAKLPGTPTSVITTLADQAAAQATQVPSSSSAPTPPTKTPPASGFLQTRPLLPTYNLRRLTDTGLIRAMGKPTTMSTWRQSPQTTKVVPSLTPPTISAQVHIPEV